MASGGRWVASHALVSIPSPADDVPTATELLTLCQEKVLWLLADGLITAKIAAKLDLSQHTVKKHLNSGTAKLAAKNRAHAVAHRCGLLR